MDPPTSPPGIPIIEIFSREIGEQLFTSDVEELPSIFSFFPGAASVNRTVGPRRMEKFGNRDGDGYLEYGPGVTIRGRSIRFPVSGCWHAPSAL
jgi:hypothetical protein